MKLMKTFLACAPSRHAPRKSSPLTIHRNLEHARLHAASTHKPVAYAPPQAFSLFGREGDALMIHTDGMCRRARLWDTETRAWRWYSCASFDPQTTKLNPSMHAERLAHAA